MDYETKLLEEKQAGMKEGMREATIVGLKLSLIHI